MWYVRFGGETFGPFEKTELDEFVQQLGTSDAVEVRRTDEEAWSAVENEGQPTEDLIFDIDQDDDEDKTLMSSDMSPEMMDELRSLLDDVPASSTKESAAPVFVPPETQVDSVPSAVVERKQVHESVVEVSLDELLSEESEIPETSSVQLEDLGLDDDKPSMLIASPNKDSAFAQKRQITTVSQTPDIQPPQSVGKSRPRTSPPELPSAVSNPSGRQQGTNVAPESANSPQEGASQDSALIPPMTSGSGPSGTTSGTASPSMSTIQTPNLASPSQPFQVESSSKGKIIKIALAVTLVVGGAGAGAIWLQKQRLKGERIEQNDGTRSLKISGRTPLNKPEKAKEVQKPSVAAPTSEKREQADAKANPKTTTENTSVKKEKESAKPELLKSKSSAASKPSKDKKIKQPKKSYKRKWVRKKTEPVLSRLNRATIEAVMKKEKTAFVSCGKATGTKLTVSMEILSSGVVRKVQLFDRGRLEKATKKCVASTFKRIVFPKTKTPVNQVRVPFTF